MVSLESPVDYLMLNILNTSISVENPGFHFEIQKIALLYGI